MVNSNNIEGYRAVCVAILGISLCLQVYTVLRNEYDRAELEVQKKKAVKELEKLQKLKF